MAATRPSFEMDRLPSGDDERSQVERGRGRASLDGDDAGPSQLAKMLMQIFDFEQPEEVIEGECASLISSVWPLCVFS